MRITLYLLRQSVELTERCLRDPLKYRERALVPSEEGLPWRLFAYAGENRPARWSGLLSGILANPDSAEEIAGRAPGAVLLVQAHERLFAITFGSGFQALDQSLIERDFGLRVAANCIDPAKITSADARGLGKGRRNALSRLPLPNEVSALGLLIDEEWIRRLGGEVASSEFAKTATGADSLVLNIGRISLHQISEKLETALSLFKTDDYTKDFPFLDYFRREEDRATITELDNAITESMRKRDAEVGFAVPDEFELTADSFMISRGRRSEFLSELSTDEVYRAIDAVDGWGDPLTGVKVLPMDIGGEAVGPREVLRKYVVGLHRREYEGRSQDYALTAGSWFRINDDYVDLVDRFMRDSVDDITDQLCLPDWDDAYLSANVEGKYGEDRYNKHLVRTRSDAVLLDQDFYRPRPGSKIEICDALTRDKKLICVKRMDGSDKMSHLFQQGEVSARMLMSDAKYRDAVVHELRRLDPDAEFGKPADWTVVYAIATSKPGSLKDEMYFFSRAALRIHGQAVTSGGFGFKVAIAKIRHIPK